MRFYTIRQSIYIQRRARDLCAITDINDECENVWICEHILNIVYYTHTITFCYYYNPWRANSARGALNPRLMRNVSHITHTHTKTTPRPSIPLPVRADVYDRRPSDGSSVATICSLINKYPTLIYIYDCADSNGSARRAKSSPRCAPRYISADRNRCANRI